MLMSVFNKHRDIALKEKRAEDEKRKQEALKRLQKSQQEKELESKPKLKELTDEEAEQLQKELDMVKNLKKLHLFEHESDFMVGKQAFLNAITKNMYFAFKYCLLL